MVSLDEDLKSKSQSIALKQLMADFSLILRAVHIMHTFLAFLYFGWESMIKSTPEEHTAQHCYSGQGWMKCVSLHRNLVSDNIIHFQKYVSASSSSHYLLPKPKLFRTTFILWVSLWVTITPPAFLGKLHPKHIYTPLTKKIIDGKSYRSGVSHTSALYYTSKHVI